MADDKLDIVIGACIAGVVGIILLCSVCIPIAVDQIGGLSNIKGITSSQLSQSESMIWIVVIMLVVGLIIAIIRHFNGSGSR